MDTNGDQDPSDPTTGGLFPGMARRDAMKLLLGAVAGAEIGSAVMARSSRTDAAWAAATSAPADPVTNPVVNVRDYGAVGDGRILWYDTEMVAGSNLLTCATRAPFTADDVGAIIKVAGAGAGGGTLVTTISQYISPSSVRTTANAGASKTGMSAAFGHDDGPAFKAAFQALAAFHGGTVVVPESPGGYVVASQQDIYFPGTPRGVNTVTLQGRNMGSRIMPLAGPTEACFAFYGPPGCDNLLVRDVTFMGAPGTVDAATVFTSSVNKTTFYNVNFYGVSGTGSVVSANGTDFSAYNTTFRGCGVVGGPVLLVGGFWRHLVLEDVSFPDFATWRDGPNDFQVGKTTQAPSALTDSWVMIGEPDPSSGANSQQNGIRIRNFRGDEGARFGIKIAPTSRITWVDIENIFMMVMTTPGGTGVSASRVDRLNIRNGRFYSNIGATQTAVGLKDVGVAELDHVIADTTAPIITADAACGTLRVRDSTYKTLASGAGRTFIDDAAPESVKTASYTLTLNDASTVVAMNVVGANTVTVPPSSSVPFPVGTLLQVFQMGPGRTTIAAGDGVTLRSETTSPTVAGQYGLVFLRKRATDEWVVAGDLLDTVAESVHTESYTLSLNDAATVVAMDVAGPHTLTVPPASAVAFPLGTLVEVYQMGAGQTTIAAGSGVTLRSDGGRFQIGGQYGSVSLRKRGVDEWVVAGDLITDSVNGGTPIDTVAESTRTGSYTLALADASTVVAMNVPTANSLTVPPNSSVAFLVGTVIEVYQMGEGQTTVTAGSGVTLRSEGGRLKIAGQYGSVSLRKRDTNEWVVAGDLVGDEMS